MCRSRSFVAQEQAQGELWQDICNGHILSASIHSGGTTTAMPLKDISPKFLDNLPFICIAENDEYVGDKFKLRFWHHSTCLRLYPVAGLK